MNDKIRYFIPKVFNHLAYEKNRIWKHLPIDKISLFGIDCCPSLYEFIERLRFILGEITPGIINESSEDEKAAILYAANHALAHEFNHLGSGYVRLNPLIWNSDLRTGFRWPANRICYEQRGVTQKGSDIKSPWELNRCPHFIWLGEAYLLTGEDKFAQEVVYEINHWIDNNPLMYSVNWTCAMEVAIRAVNWLYALNMIAGSKALTEKTIVKVYKSLFQHGFFIINHRERTIPYSNNHYYSDLIGLLYIGRLFYATRKGRRWYRLAKREYYRETLVEFLPSGINYEKSVSYHRLMVELGVYTYFMLKRVGEVVPQAMEERLTHAIDYVKVYSMPNGNAPMVADNDDGRLLPFVPRDLRKHLYLTEIKSLEMKIATIGVEPLQSRINKLDSRLYQDAKIAVLRKEDCFLMITLADRCRFDRDNGGYIGTHLHNDLLSFIYTVGNEEVFVDPGGYVYTSDLKWHKEFRTTAKHNTIVVDGEEQHLREKDATFTMKYNSTSSQLVFSSEEEVEHCLGVYKTQQGQLIHNREFFLSNDRLILKDTLTKKGSNHKAEVFFHLAPGIAPEVVYHSVCFKTATRVFYVAFNGASNDVKLSIIDDKVSTSFGVLHESKTVVYKMTFDDKAEITTSISHKDL